MAEFRGLRGRAGADVCQLQAEPEERQSAVEQRIAGYFPILADHGDNLLDQITSRYGNQRKLNRIIAEPMILDMQSMGYTVSEYLKHGGFFKLPGQRNLQFPELLTLCTAKESHNSITGTILGFQFKRWLLEIFMMRSCSSQARI